MATLCSLTGALSADNPFFVENHRKKIRNILPAKDLSVSLENLKKEIEDQIDLNIPITTRANGELEIIKYTQENYIVKRNKIIRNPLKYYNPFYWGRLKKIEAKLDELELKIYYLEKRNEPNLKRMLEDIENKKKRCRQFLRDLESK